MYNMDISIFGYKLNLEILILIGVVYLILVGHTLCGCCNMGRIMEGLTDMADSVMDASGNKIADAKKAVEAKIDMPTQAVAGDNADATTSTTSDVSTAKKEGFTGANINYGESSLYSLSNDTPVDTSSWSAQNMTVTPGQPLSAGVKAFMERKPTQVPLPEGEMFMFANTEFKPECCPNTYSNSSGCACMDANSYNYLITRGGNNLPYSEY